MDALNALNLRTYSGLNHSGIHCDIMYGTDDTEITGVTADGRSVKIMENGVWCDEVICGL